MPANCRQAPFWSWEAAHRVFKSPKTCIKTAEKSTSAWVVIGASRDATAVATMHGGRSSWDMFERTAPGVRHRQNGASIPPGPLLTGVNGGYEADLRELASKGIVLLGRLKAVKGARLALAPDLEENLAKGDEWLANFKKSVDDYIAKNKLNIPEESTPVNSSPSQEGRASTPILELDLRAAGITSIIWATGFGNDYDWLKLPLLDERGEPLHERGVTQFPGIYFLGLALALQTEIGFSIFRWPCGRRGLSGGADRRETERKSESVFLMFLEVNLRRSEFTGAVRHPRAMVKRKLPASETGSEISSRPTKPGTLIRLDSVRAMANQPRKKSGWANFSRVPNLWLDVMATKKGSKRK